MVHCGVSSVFCLYDGENLRSKDSPTCDGPKFTPRISALQEGRVEPQAFRRPVLDRNGKPIEFPHQYLERVRQTVRDKVRGKK